MPQTLDSTTGPTSSQQNGGSRSILRESKEELIRSSSSDVPNDAGVHYGRKFGETVERFQARHAEREAHAADEPSEPTTPAEAKETPAEAKETTAAAKEAQPETPEAAAHLSPSLVEEVVSNAWSRVTAFTKATGAFLHSGWNLAMLPRDTLMQAARHLRRTHAS